MSIQYCVRTVPYNSDCVHTTILCVQYTVLILYYVGNILSILYRMNSFVQSVTISYPYYVDHSHGQVSLICWGQSVELDLGWYTDAVSVNYLVHKILIVSMIIILSTSILCCILNTLIVFLLWYSVSSSGGGGSGGVYGVGGDGKSGMSTVKPIVNVVRVFTCFC